MFEPRTCINRPIVNVYMFGLRGRENQNQNQLSQVTGNQHRNSQVGGVLMDMNICCLIVQVVTFCLSSMLFIFCRESESNFEALLLV